MVVVLATALSYGQNINRTYKAIRATEKPKIDGKPFEIIWETANIGSDFKILRPDNGLSENKNQRSLHFFMIVKLIKSVLNFQSEMKSMYKQTYFHFG